LSSMWDPTLGLVPHQRHRPQLKARARAAKRRHEIKNSARAQRSRACSNRPRRDIATSVVR
jgi:hypothetical protein